MKLREIVVVSGQRRKVSLLLMHINYSFHLDGKTIIALLPLVRVQFPALMVDLFTDFKLHYG